MQGIGSNCCAATFVLFKNFFTLPAKAKQSSSFSLKQSRVVERAVASTWFKLDLKHSYPNITHLPFSFEGNGLLIEMLLGPQTYLDPKTTDSRPWEQHLQIRVRTSKLQVRSRMKLWSFMANNCNGGGGASKTNAVQGRVNLWIEFVNRNIYSLSVFGCCQWAFAGLECSQGAYLHCNSNEFRAGMVVLGAQEGFGPWWESSRLPGIDLVGRKSLPPGGGRGRGGGYGRNTGEINPQIPNPLSFHNCPIWPFHYIVYPWFSHSWANPHVTKWKTNEHAKEIE